MPDLGLGLDFIVAAPIGWILMTLKGRANQMTVCYAQDGYIIPRDINS